MLTELSPSEMCSKSRSSHIEKRAKAEKGERILGSFCG